MSDSRRAAIVSFAMAQLGKPYRYGATGPSAFDCSGLVWDAYRSVGISIPRTSEEQYAAAKPISRNQLQPGDPVFFVGAGDAPPGHEALYIGGGQVIEAPHTGDVVKTVSLDTISAYDSYMGSGNFLGDVAGSSTGAGGGAPRSRPGQAAPPPGYQDVLFGIPGTPSLPWLDIPGGVSSFFSGLWSDVTDIPSALVSLAKTLALGVKFFIWFMDPKNWLRVIEVLFGTALIVHALFLFGKLFSKPGDTVPRTVFRGARAAATHERAPAARPKRTAGARARARAERRRRAMAG